MRLSSNQVASLQTLLRELGLDYTDEQTQEAGMAILRFVIVKAQREKQLATGQEVENDKA